MAMREGSVGYASSQRTMAYIRRETQDTLAGKTDNSEVIYDALVELSLYRQAALNLKRATLDADNARQMLFSLVM